MKLLPKFICTWLLRRAFFRHNAAFTELRRARERDAYSAGGPWEAQALDALGKAQREHRKSVALLSRRLKYAV